LYSSCRDVGRAAMTPLGSLGSEVGMVPQLVVVPVLEEPVLEEAVLEEAAVPVLGELAALDELLDALDEQAARPRPAARASAVRPPADTALIYVSFDANARVIIVGSGQTGGAVNRPGSGSLKDSLATSSFIGLAVPHWS
jgi:hypothetical protein